MRAESHEEFALAQEGGYAVAIDTTVDDELRAEGIARDLIRLLNDQRKATGLEIADRVRVRLGRDRSGRSRRARCTATGSRARCWRSSSWCSRAPMRPVRRASRSTATPVSVDLERVER